MSDELPQTGLDAFEARLRALAERVRSGFPQRAIELRTAVTALEAGETTAREDIRRYAHKVRGTAGSHGFHALTERAEGVEKIAIGGEREDVAIRARELADALEAEGRASPAAAPAEPQPRAEPISEVMPKVVTLAGLRVVAVDDDASTRKLLALTLTNVGRAEASVEDRPSGLLARLRTERFDIVIVDAMMPDTNGLACLEQIVEQGLHHEGTRYFVLSAATAAELSWSLPPVLAASWLRKPFRPRELVDAIALALGR